MCYSHVAKNRQLSFSFHVRIMAPSNNTKRTKFEARFLNTLSYGRIKILQGIIIYRQKIKSAKVFVYHVMKEKCHQTSLRKTKFSVIVKFLFEVALLSFGIL
jgi:hypothetical protein